MHVWYWPPAAMMLSCMLHGALMLFPDGVGVCRELQIIHTDFKPENVMLFDTLSPRHWEMQLQPVNGPPPAAAAAAAGRAAGSGGQAPSGSAGLTKNQKKKAKKKAKKAAAGGSAEVGGKMHALLLVAGKMQPAKQMHWLF
jgi:hypothetical protein